MFTAARAIPEWPVAEVASSHEAYPSQGPISVQPRDARAAANPCYGRELAVASGGVGAGPQRWIMGSQSVLVAR